MKAQVAYFSIDGAWLSNFVRTRVMEGAWENALKIKSPGINYLRDC
jgi:hypothetical protein